MTGNELRKTVDFESGLTLGDIVEVRWTNNFRYLTCKAEVVRLNRASVRIKLVEPPIGYAVGQAFAVPRFGANGWSCNNCVAPLPSP